MKRLIAICFLILANAIWLTYSILPHHHHGSSQACMISQHCDNERATHDHHHNSVPHKHDTNNTAQCALKQLAIVPIHIIKGANSQLTYSGSSDFYLSSPSVHSYSIFKNSTEPVIIQGSPPILYYILHLSRSFGLRAPPTA